MVDYRALNAATVPDAHPLPLIEKEIAARAKGKLSTVLDLRHGFHQMPLRKEDRHLTAMCTPCGTVQWTVLKRYGVLHPYPLPSLWRSSPDRIRNFPVDVTASRFLWDFCKIPQKSSFFVIFGLATTVVACATQPQIEDLFLDF